MKCDDNKRTIMSFLSLEDLLLQKNLGYDGLQSGDYILLIDVKVKYLIERSRLLHWSKQQIKMVLSLSCFCLSYRTILNLVRPGM